MTKKIDPFESPVNFFFFFLVLFLNLVNIGSLIKKEKKKKKRQLSKLKFILERGKSEFFLSQADKAK